MVSTRSAEAIRHHKTIKMFELILEILKWIAGFAIVVFTWTGFCVSIAMRRNCSWQRLRRDVGTMIFCVSIFLVIIIVMPDDAPDAKELTHCISVVQSAIENNILD